MVAFPATWALQANGPVNKRNLSAGENGFMFKLLRAMHRRLRPAATNEFGGDPNRGTLEIQAKPS